MNYPGFTVSYLYSQGVKLIKDDEGNLLATKLTKNDIIVKGYKDPANHCLSEEVIQAMGRLQNDRPMKVGYHTLSICKSTMIPNKIAVYG